MPTRSKPSAPSDHDVDLLVLGPLVNYTPESLRKMMWTADPPPLRKVRGRWRGRPSEVKAWAARRDGLR